MLDITNLAQFESLRAKSLLIIDFHAHWCGPCKAISPVFEKLAKPFRSSTSIIFAKVDVDAVKDVAQACGISAMPTFQFYKHGSKVDEMRGADVQGLTTKIGYYTSAAVKASAGQGTKLGETRSFQASPSVSVGQGSLRSLLDIEACKMLNASGRSSVKSVIKPTFAGAVVESASGAQLLIHLVFLEQVNLTSLRILVPEDSTSQAPSKVHLGNNLDTPKDMNALLKAENVQSFTLFSDEYSKGTAELKLKSAKFTKTKCLTVLIASNISADAAVATKIGQLDVIGSKVSKS